MNSKSTTPRPPINQGIDINNQMVIRHTTIYNSLLSHVTEGSPTAGWSHNPYGTAPLSGYLGVWSTSTNPIRVQISDDIGSVSVDYTYTPVIGANLIPIVGFSPDAANQFVVTIPGIGTVSTTILTNPLPPTDEELGSPSTEGFPIFEVTSPMSDPPETINELYFASYFGRYNVGIDHEGTVRWYTTREIPSFNTFRIANGHFLATANDFNEFKHMYEFDVVGRVHAFYVLDNNCHHSIEQLPNGNILFPSEYSDPNSDPTSYEPTTEDGISIMDATTGLEIAYYDTRDIMDFSRNPRPRTPADYSEYYDWIHINQSYYDEVNNLIINSGRQQGVFGFDFDTAELVFVMAPHFGWSEDFNKYLLTPVDEAGNPIYDLSDESDADRADKEFWNWGQHSVIRVPNEAVGIIDFIILNNSNFRAREDALSVPPYENHTNIGRYRIDLSNMTITKLFEYGKDEVGNKGYSSYVCNVRILDNGNYLVNFGGVMADENDRRLTIQPGYTDLVDPLEGDSVLAKLLLQEINPNNKDLIIEFNINTGKYKNFEEYGTRYDLSCFCAYKLTMIP